MLQDTSHLACYAEAEFAKKIVKVLCGRLRALSKKLAQNKIKMRLLFSNSVVHAIFRGTVFRTVTLLISDHLTSPAICCILG